jgi:hypothetical protein
VSLQDVEFEPSLMKTISKFLEILWRAGCHTGSERTLLEEKMANEISEKKIQFIVIVNS